MLFKSKLFRNINKIFYTLKKKFLIVQNSFSLALFSLFFGFLCGNLFGTFLGTLRIYFLWNGFVAFIILLFIEAINFFVYRIPLTKKIKTNLSISNIRNFNFLLRRSIRSLFNLRFFLYPPEEFGEQKDEMNVRSKVAFTSEAIPRRGKELYPVRVRTLPRSANTVPRWGKGSEGKKGVAYPYPEGVKGMQQSEMNVIPPWGRKRRTLWGKVLHSFHLVRVRTLWGKKRGSNERLALPNWQKGYTKRSYQQLDSLPRKAWEAGLPRKGYALVDKNKKILFTIYIERSLNAFKIGLLFGFFIDSFKVGS